MRIVRPVVINDATLVSSNVTEESTAPLYNAGTTYALADLSYRVGTHRVYRSLQAANTGNTPESSPTWWQEIRATDKYKMFDSKAASQTQRADNITVSIAPAERIDLVELLTVDASSVHITATDATDGVVFDETYSMVSDSGIQDWYAYFFEPVVRRRKLLADGIPPYAGLTMDIVITDTGATAGCGECIMGLSRELGGTEYGARIGIRDFSVKSQDEFGNFDVLERAFSKRGTFSLEVDAGFEETLHEILETYRATPVLWIGADSRVVTHIYGYYVDFQNDLTLSTKSYCSLDIEGLT
jgi:hypothetical protein